MLRIRRFTNRKRFFKNLYLEGKRGRLEKWYKEEYKNGRVLYCLELIY